MSLPQDGKGKPNVSSYISALKSCTSSKDLHSARRIRDQLIGNGKVPNIFVANMLLDTFAKCGSMLDARHLFDQMGCQVDVVSWNSLINGYVQNRQAQRGLEMFSYMHQEGLSPNARTFIAVLKACALSRENPADKVEQDTDWQLISLIRSFHGQAASRGFESDIFVANTLVDTYAKAGNLEDAQQVFGRMPDRNIISWTALIMGYAQYGQEELALELFTRMQRKDEGSLEPNERTFVAALKACSNFAMKEDGVRVYTETTGRQQVVKMNSLEKGMAVHAQLKHADLESGQHVVSSLVDMYANCGSLEDADRIFHRTEGVAHDVVSWNSIIMAHAQCGEAERALELFYRMQHEQGDVTVPNSRSFISALTACSELSVRERAQQVEGKLAKLHSLEEGMKIHFQFGKLCYESNTFVANSLIDMYSKCGSMVDAQRVFDRMLKPNVISWTALLSGYAQNGDGQKALELFEYVKNEGSSSSVNARTYVAALNACAAVAAKEEVDEKLMVKVESMEKLLAVHVEAGKSGYLSHSYVQSSLVNAYAKCGSMEDASRVFRSTSKHDLVSWNSMILGFAQAGDTDSSLELFERMRREEVAPDSATYVALLKACANSPENLRKGEEIHAQLVKNGYGSQSPLVGNTLVDMYAKCGDLKKAREIFEEMEMMNRDVVSWNAIISGYAQSSDNAHAEEALHLFAKMAEEGFAPDEVTFMAVLKCCGTLAALRTGKEIHHEMQELGLLLNRVEGADDERRKRVVVLGTCLVDFYGKCGSMTDAMEVFESMQTRNTFTWNAALAGFSQQGNATHVLWLFERMKAQDKVNKPNRISLLILLSACSHAGLIDKAKEIFSEMSSLPLGYNGVVPDVEHYSCMVDMLGRANHLGEALEILDNVPFEAGKTLWLTLLSACQNWGNVEIGKKAFEKVMSLDDRDGSAYILMSNIYASAGTKEYRLCKDGVLDASGQRPVVLGR